MKTQSDNYIYMISYNTNCNFSIYLNDFLLYENNKTEGNQGCMIELNPFIPASALQQIKVIIKNDNNDLKSSDLIKQHFQLIRAKTPLDENKFEEISKAKFVFIPNESIVSIIEFTPNVNYDGKEINLAQSKDLSKIDKDELTKKILDFYQKYGEIINLGDVQSYKKLFKNAHDREIISMYYTPEQANKMIEKLSNRIAESKGGLQPIEDYELYIHPNRKIVELIGKNGKSPLLSKVNGKIRRFGVYLHMPVNSNNLTIY